MNEFAIEKGINLSHWLSQVFGWSPRNSFVLESDIADIKEKGFDHVRLPIDEEELWDENGKQIDSAFHLMQQCVEWCIKHELRIIIDVHILRSHHFNAANGEGEIRLWTDAKAQEDFLNLWTQLQAVLSQYPNEYVAYEIMNEPVAEDHDDWNKLLERGYKLIRQTEPERVLIIGSNLWQNPDTFPYLKLPADATGIILSCHMYEPLLFSHYKAYWLPIKDYTGAVQYPGQCISEADYKTVVATSSPECIAMVNEKNGHYDKDKLIELLLPAITKAKELGFPLYCSEFGCLDSVDRQQQLKYFSDLKQAFVENNIAFCLWDYLGDFGLRAYDRTKHEKGEWDTDIANILIG